MKYTRPRIIEHQPVVGSFDVNGNPTTTAVEVQTAVSDLVLGDGSSTVSVLQRDGETRKDVDTIALPADFNDDATFEILINGNRRIFVAINTKDLGGGTLTGIKVLVEFNDPDHPEFWLPSKEGVNREASSDLNEWVLTGVGNWVVTTREEHRHFTKARVRFKVLSGTADGDTQIFTSWFHDGGVNLIEKFGNDPL